MEIGMLNFCLPLLVTALTKETYFRCKNCQISSIGYRFIGGKLELLHSASDCSNVEKSVGITKFLSLCQCIKINSFLSYDFGPNDKTLQLK